MVEWKSRLAWIFNSILKLDFDRLTHPDYLFAVFSSLRPFEVSGGLTRLGGNSDGSYLLPIRAIENLDGCISPGVGNSSKFENDLFNQKEMKMVLVDGNIKQPPNIPKKAIFINQNLSPFTDATRNVISISNLLETHFAEQKNLLLQLDIEGGEYTNLLAMDESLYNRFEIIIVEFHDLNRWKRRSHFNGLFQPALEKVLNFHVPVHLHINERGPQFHFGKVTFPSVIEVTFARKGSPYLTKNYGELPNPLDINNNDENKNFNFEKFWRSLENN